MSFIVVLELIITILSGIAAEATVKCAIAFFLSVAAISIIVRWGPPTKLSERNSVPISQLQSTIDNQNSPKLKTASRLLIGTLLTSLFFVVYVSVVASMFFAQFMGRLG